MHPTVVYNALKIALSTSAAGVSSNDVFVQLSGGTPEGIVGAMLLGFTKVFYIAGSEREVQWMTPPSKHEESAFNIDYRQYSSPDPDLPERGFLAAEAIQMLVPYLRNFVFETPGSVMLPPPVAIEIPPLQTFTFVQVTGKVIARTIQSQQSGSQSAQSGSQSAQSAQSQRSGSQSAQSGPGSAAGKEVPDTPVVKGKLKKAQPKEEEGTEGEDDDEGDQHLLHHPPNNPDLHNVTKFALHVMLYPQEVAQCVCHLVPSLDWWCSPWNRSLA